MTIAKGELPIAIRHECLMADGLVRVCWVSTLDSMLIAVEPTGHLPDVSGEVHDALDAYWKSERLVDYIDARVTKDRIPCTCGMRPVSGECQGPGCPIFESRR